MKFIADFLAFPFRYIKNFFFQILDGRDICNNSESPHKMALGIVNGARRNKGVDRVAFFINPGHFIGLGRILVRDVPCPDFEVPFADEVPAGSSDDLFARKLEDIADLVVDIGNDAAAVLNAQTLIHTFHKLAEFFLAVAQSLFRLDSFRNIHHGGDALRSSRNHGDGHKNMEKITALALDLEFVISGRRRRVIPSCFVERKKAIDIVFGYICSPRMADDFLTGIAREIRKIVVHHGNGRVLFDDDCRCAGIFEQRSVEMPRMGQLIFDLLILLGLRSKIFDFLVGRFQFVYKLNPVFVSFSHCSTSSVLFG